MIADTFSFNVSYGVRDGEYDRVDPTYAVFLGPELPRLAPSNYLEDEANWGNLTSIAGLYTAGPVKKGREIGLEVNFRY